MYSSYFSPFIPMPGRLVSRFLTVLLALAMLLASQPITAGPAGPAIAPDFGKLPLSFVPNTGQTNPTVRFQAHAMGGTLFFTPGEVVLALPAATDNHRPATPAEGRRSAVSGQRSSVVRVRFEGANPTPEIRGADRLPGMVNYFIGNDPGQWRTNLPTYNGIIYRDLYPGIDLHYEGGVGANNGSLLLKGAYTVAPGVDPTRVRWRYEGATSVGVDEATGDLLVTLPTAAGTDKSQIIEHAPVAWQTINGRRVPVSIRYVMVADGSIGFALGRYDPAYPLIVDPTLTYSTYLGGGSYDCGRGIAVDADGNAYVIGQTNSTDFPTQNPLQPDLGGGPLGDVFVVKLNPTGSALIYATYLGGSHNDSGYDIVVDGEGNAYVTGDTLSANFPTQNPVQPISGGGGPFEGDAFVAKLDPTGSALVYATYLGGGGDELSYGIALDNLGNAYVTGYTSSTDFPTVKPVQPDPAFGQGLNVYGDAFVTQVISASGVYTWGYATYLGGLDLDVGRSIAVDASGSAYVTGHTHSTDFPTANPVQPTFGGGSSFGRGDAFVTRIISASGVYTWGYSTYLGGSGDDSGYGIAVDDSGDAYVIGETVSTDFPTASPIQGAYGGDQDAFVTKVISASGVYTWGYSTYLGGDGTDIGRDIALDAEGYAYLTGYSFSPDFPMTDDAYDPSCGTDGLCDSAGGDVFFTKLNDTGDALAYSTYLGGSSTDFGHSIAIDTSGNAYLTGFIYSADFPTTTGAFDTACGTDGQCDGFATDAFVAKITMAPDLLVTKAADPPAGTSVTQGDIITYTIVAANAYPAGGAGGGSPAANVFIADVIPAGTAYVPDSVTTTLGVAGFDGTQVTVSVPSLTASASLTSTFRVTVTTGLTTTVTNEAVLIADQMEPLGSNLVSHPVRGTGGMHIAYLPVVFKDSGEPLPPGCAPYLVATIPVGDTPRGIAVDSTRNRVYVANYASNSVSVIDSSDNSVVQTITGITSANGVVYDLTHNVIWVTNYSSDQVTPIQANSDATGFTILSPITVGDGPWGVAYDPVHDYVYAVNNLGNSVTVVDAGSRTVVTTLGGSFDQPFHAAVNPVTGKGYVTNFGSHSVVAVNGTTVSGVVNLNTGNPSTQPYGIAVDETRDLVYVATLDSHRVVVIGELAGVPDQLLGWAAFRRGFGDPARPVPLRAVVVNPDIGPASDGGHVWAVTTTADGSEADQALLIPKGWAGGFSYPVPYGVGANPVESIAVDRASDRVYVTSGDMPGTVTVLGDGPNPCLIPFSTKGDGIGIKVSTVANP